MELYAYCTLAIIAITCWVSYLGFRSQAFEEKYLFWPEAILAWKEWYRLITPGFLHLDWMHLGMNMLSLYFFGPTLEERLGIVQFLAIYLGAIVGGNLLALYIHRNHDYRALGASGGVSGIILAYIFLFPGSPLSLSFVPVFVPGWLWGIGYLLASFYGMRTAKANVGHDAHLGGALVGLFITAGMHPMMVRYNLVFFCAISIGTLLLFIYLVRNPLMLPMDGMDFTIRRAGTGRQAGRFAMAKLFRRNRSPVPVPPTRAEKEVDAILQRIATEGINSLTEEEKRLLNDTSAKYRRRAVRENPKWGFPF